MPPEQTAELAAPQTAPSAMPPADLAAGLKLAPLTGQLRRHLQIPREVSGAVVTAVPEAGPLSGADLSPGDVIEMINQEPVASPADAVAKLRAAAAGGRKTVLVLVNRHGSNRYLALSVTAQFPPEAPG
jgi:serine protease Do